MLKTQKERTEKRKTNVYDKSSELYNDLLEIYFDEYNDLQVSKRKKINSKYNPDNLMLDTCEYENWYEEESDDSTLKNEEKELDDLPPMHKLPG